MKKYIYWELKAGNKGLQDLGMFETRKSFDDIKKIINCSTLEIVPSEYYPFEANDKIMTAYMDEEARLKDGCEKNHFFKSFLVTPEQQAVEKKQYEAMGMEYITDMVPKDDKGNMIFDIVGDVIIEIIYDDTKQDTYDSFIEKALAGIDKERSFRQGVKQK